MKILYLCLIGLLVGSSLAQISEMDYMDCLERRQCNVEPTCPANDPTCDAELLKLKNCVDTNTECLNLRPTMLDENSATPIPTPYLSCFRACYAVPYESSTVNQYAQCIAQCGIGGTAGIASAVTTVDASQFEGTVVEPVQQPDVVVLPTPVPTTPTEDVVVVTPTPEPTPEEEVVVVTPTPEPTPEEEVVVVTPTPEPTEGEDLIVTPTEGEDVLVVTPEPTPPPPPPQPQEEVTTRPVLTTQPVVPVVPIVPVLPVQTTQVMEGEGEAVIIETESEGEAVVTEEEDPLVAVVRTRTTTAAVTDGEILLQDGEIIIDEADETNIAGEVPITPRNVNIRPGGSR